MASAVDVANVLEDWKVVWEQKVIRMGENEKEASKALKDKLEGILIVIRAFYHRLDLSKTTFRAI